MIPEFISLTESDFSRLLSLTKEEQNEEARKLEVEIERAQVLSIPDIPDDLVTMNSHFTYFDLSENRASEMTLVYPHQADSKSRFISVLAPLGAAFLGLREGEEIEWNFPQGKTKRLRVLNVLYQPEASGDFHL
jgi:regulator of nucleoside diphosphate kinase